MNYIGNKTKLLEFLETSIKDFTKIEEFDGEVFADLFAGTCSVGAYFKSLGCKVIANDIQEYSYVLCKNLIDNNKKFSDKLIEDFNNLEPVNGYFTQTYSPAGPDKRMYWTEENAMKIDACLKYLKESLENKTISKGEYYFLLASLIESATKFSNTMGTFGAHAKHWTGKSSKLLEITPCQPKIGKYKGKSYNETAETLISKISGDILYQDIPYGTRSYSSNFSPLETLAKNDNMTVHGKTGIRDDVSTQKSAFCSKATALPALEQIVKDAKFKYIFLSYSTDGIMKEEDIKKMFEKYGNVKVYRQLYKRYKADKSDKRKYDESDLYELLFALEKD